MAGRKSKLWPYWRYAILAVLLLAVADPPFGPAGYAILVGLLAIYTPFQAPPTAAPSTVAEGARSSSAATTPPACSWAATSASTSGRSSEASGGRWGGVRR